MKKFWLVLDVVVSVIVVALTVWVVLDPGRRVWDVMLGVVGCVLVFFVWRRHYLLAKDAKTGGGGA